MNSDKQHDSLKVLIFGGAGFIGSNLAEEFVNLGAKVTIVDGFVEHTGANIRNIEKIKCKVKLYNNKVSELKNFPELIEESDLIIDSMALASHTIGMKNPLLDVEANLTAHVRLINALKDIKDAKNKKVIYLGSIGQYGRADKQVITEETRQNPIDVQGTNKSATENLYKIYSKKCGFGVASLRIVNCFGENQQTNGNDIGLVGSFIRNILDGKTVEIFGNEERKKNILYVKDLVKTIIKLSQQKTNGFEAYNVTGVEISLKNLLNNIIEVAGKGAFIVKPFPAEIRNIDLGDAKYLNEKIKRAFGDMDSTDIGIALHNTIEYFKKAMKTTGTKQ